jgi:hypothetical protein
VAFHHGKDSYFLLDGQNLSQYVTSVDFNESGDVAESTTLGKDAKTYIQGQTDATISITGNWDETASTGPDAVLNGVLGAGLVDFEYGPMGDVNGAVLYTGSCILTSYGKSSPVGDIVSFSAEGQVSGVVTRTTQLTS